MVIKAKTKDKKIFDSLVDHPLQTWSWGEFRRSTNVDVSRLIETVNGVPKKAIQITWHKVPFFRKSIGYAPKSDLPSQRLLEEIKKIAKQRNAIFVKFEPKVLASDVGDNSLLNQAVPGKPLFTKFTFVLDLSPSESELLGKMNQKTRYNIRLAQRRGVEIVRDNSEQAFEEYWGLTVETTKRQNFYSHTKKYHREMWSHMINKGSGQIFKAVFEGETLVTWVVFVHNKKIYYPYGASTNRHREVMANNLMMWEVIKYGKSLGCTEFDMWGSLGSNPDKNDSWYGFHKFKEGYGGKLCEFIGTYDLVVSKIWYLIYKISDTIRWRFLRLVKR